MEKINFKSIDEQIVRTLFHINYKDTLLEGNSREEILMKDFEYAMKVVFNNNLLFEVSNPGVQEYLLDSIASYDDLRVIKWLQDYFSFQENSTWLETIQKINSENSYKTLEILRVMRNCYDKEAFQNKIIKKSEYLERLQITKDLFDICLYNSLMK